MLEFYEFNTFNICVVMISTFVLYYILSNTLGKSANSDKENEEFNIEYLIISILISICISLGISYVMSGSDEALLTDNYWENTNLE
jgi:ascorbate-specific PTS system EIIC-type component UlaA